MFPFSPFLIYYWFGKYAEKVYSEPTPSFDNKKLSEFNFREKKITEKENNNRPINDNLSYDDKLSNYETNKLYERYGYYNNNKIGCDNSFIMRSKDYFNEDNDITPTYVTF